MGKVLGATILKTLTKQTKKRLGGASFRAVTISLLFIFSGVGASFLIAPVAGVPNAAASPVPAASTPLTQAQANWAYTDGNQFAQNFNPQNQINASNAQYLGVNWLFPIPGVPQSLGGGVGGGFGGVGVDTTPIIANGTIYFTTQYFQIFALNAANGDIIWTQTIPLTLNSSAGLYGGSLGLHIHQGPQAFTTANFGWNSGAPLYWLAASNEVIYAINALSGKFVMNFTAWHGISDVSGNSPTSTYSAQMMIIIDSQRGILVNGMESTSQANAARGWDMGWNIMTNPPTHLWTSYYAPPQPNGGVPLDPNWTISMVNSMKSAQIFYPGPQYNGGGSIPGTAVVDLKTLSQSQLNSTLYNDWGQIGQSAQCLAITGGQSTGSVGSGWGGTYVMDQKAGIAYVSTGNRAPYVSPCNPGPDLWASSVLAINDTNGQWIWGFQTSAHDNWDWDCSWFQSLANATVAGVNTQVLIKTCKNGYLYEINAATGHLIWAWTPPTSTLPRCIYCYIQNPLNRTQMTNDWAAPNDVAFIANPSELAGFESTGVVDPVTGLIYVASHNVPSEFQHVPLNASNYATSQGINSLNPQPGLEDNASIEAVDLGTGQMIWSYPIPITGFRGGLMASGNVVYVPYASGDLTLLNAKTGALIKDLYLGAPMDVVPSIGSTIKGQEEVIQVVGSPSFFLGGVATPGDVVALTLTGQPPAASTTTIISTTTTLSTTTSISVSTAPAGSASVSTVTSVSTTTLISTQGGGINSSVTYGVAAVAVIFIIATGYLAMRGRRTVT
jgi:outer membrane protein assembly factor BamB